MPTTLNPTVDGHVGARTSDWNTLLTATSGKSVNTSSTAGSGTAESSGTFSIGAARSISGGTHNHRHSFFEFDTSAIASVNAAKLRLYVDSVGVSNHEIIVCQGTFSGIASVSFFNSFTRIGPYNDSGVQMVPGQYNDITFNIAGEGAISSLSTLKLMVIDYEYVFLEQQPSANTTAITNIRYSEDSSFPPQLVIEEGPPPPGPVILTSGLVQITEGLISI